jgi:hypothetical protein
VIDKKDIAAVCYVIDSVQTIWRVVVRLDRDFLFTQWIDLGILIIVIMTSSYLVTVTRITLSVVTSIIIMAIAIEVPTSLFVVAVPQSKSEMQSRVEGVMKNFLSDDSMQISWQAHAMQLIGVTSQERIDIIHHSTVPVRRVKFRSLMNRDRFIIHN